MIYLIFCIWSLVELIFRSYLLKLQGRQIFINNLILLTQKVLEFKIILNDFISSSFNVMQEWACLLSSILTLSFFQEIHAVLWGAKTTFESRVAWSSSNFQTVKAFEGYCDVNRRVIPNIHSALSLLFVVVFGIIVYQNSRNISVLPKKLLHFDHVFVSVLFGEPNDVKQIWYHHSELLKFRQVQFFVWRYVRILTKMLLILLIFVCEITTLWALDETLKIHFWN